MIGGTEAKKRECFKNMGMVSGDNRKNNFTKMMRTEGCGKEQKVEEGQMEASYTKILFQNLGCGED